LRELWVGPDFALGHRRQGTTTRPTEIGHELGHQVHVVPPLVLNGQTVSSILIRNLVWQGQVETAARLLGRWHHIGGTVVPCYRRGRHLSLPTVNVALAAGLILPANGVYAAYARLGGRQWPTRAYVGPAFAGTGRQLQVSIPDLADDLYGHCLRVEFVRRLRSDVRCASAPASTEQMEKDLAQVRQALSPV
jgi:riboflavin kinase/FMN adenylyltransferase